MESLSWEFYIGIYKVLTFCLSICLFMIFISLSLAVFLLFLSLSFGHSFSSFRTFLAPHSDPFHSSQGFLRLSSILFSLFNFYTLSLFFFASTPSLPLSPFFELDLFDSHPFFFVTKLSKYFSPIPNSDHRTRTGLSTSFSFLQDGRYEVMPIPEQAVPERHPPVRSPADGQG